MGTFEIIDRPDKCDPLPSMFTYRLKTGDQGQIIKYKARLCARGDLQLPDEHGDPWAPTSRYSTIRLMIALATQLGLELMHWDVRGAYMVANLDRELYLDLPPGYELPPDKVIRMKKSLYGLKDAGANFYKLLSNWLQNYGFTAIGADKVTYKMQRGTSVIYITLFVDDGLCATNDLKFYNEFLKDLESKFELGESGKLTWYLGVSIKQDTKLGFTQLSQRQYVLDLLERFNMVGCKTAPTAMQAHLRLSKTDCPPEAERDKKTVEFYNQLVGSLQYLSVFTRPDISQAVNQCSRFLANPGPTHIEAAKHILRYLAGSADYALTYTQQPPELANMLWGAADSDHAGDPDTRRSTTGYVMMLNGSAISWQSTRQALVSLSSTEAEFYAASVAGCDVVYLRRLCQDLGFEQASATPVMEDNVVCIYLSRNATMFHKSKHIDVRVYKLREFCNDGPDGEAKVMDLCKVNTADNPADMFTKALPGPAFAQHRDTVFGMSLRATGG